ncbi:hypothetical protein ETH_00033470, partial [Eimeria tenella]
MEEVEREGKEDLSRRHWRLGLRNPQISIHRFAAQLGSSNKGSSKEDELLQQSLTRLMLLPLTRPELKETLLHAIRKVKSRPRAVAALLHLTLVEEFPTLDRMKAFNILKKNGFDANEVAPACEELLVYRQELQKQLERQQQKELLATVQLGWQLGLLRYPGLAAAANVCLCETKIKKEKELKAAEEEAAQPSLDPKHPADQHLKTILPQEATRMMLHCGILDMSDYFFESPFSAAA